MVPEAKVTILDSKTLSGPFGWQVQAAALGVKAGWVLGDILKLVDQIRENQQTLFTLGDLKYLIHGGRISHLKGLLASVLNLKPVIGVAKDDGKYYNWGQAPTLKTRNPPDGGYCGSEVSRWIAPAHSIDAREQPRRRFHPERTPDGIAGLCV